ncbi:MAG: alpha/beta hydrolase-fold protein [Candidatus Acidiferrum sp.]
MPRERLFWQIRGAALLLLFLATGITSAAELSKDDIDFRKDVYVSSTKDRLPYRLFVPLGYDTNRKYPLLLWLHGADGRGSDNVKQLTHENQLGTHFWIASQAQIKFPVFVLVPQCPSGENWAEPEFNQPSKWLLLTMEVLAKVQKQFLIDPDRLYIGGQAMGGLGVWSLLQMYRGNWAGAIVMSAYDTFTDIPAITQVPLWVFQGDADESVPVDMVRAMTRQLKKAHANLRYTEYHKADHLVWSKAFAEPDLLPWLSAQKRGSPAGGQLGSGGPPPSH